MICDKAFKTSALAVSTDIGEVPAEKEENTSQQQASHLCLFSWSILIDNVIRIQGGDFSLKFNE